MSRDIRAYVGIGMEAPVHARERLGSAQHLCWGRRLVVVESGTGRE
jgi:hypothetical protein